MEHKIGLRIEIVFNLERFEKKLTFSMMQTKEMTAPF